ncbi:MAG: AAA family ATPase [Fimbriimonadales bacterium]
MARASVVLVAGVSCSGKTTLARVLAAKLDAAYVAIDDYYRPYAELPLEIRKKVNFDSPEAIEHELLVHHLTRLRSGETIAKPMYDPAGFRRRPEIEPVHADRAVIVEGLFSLYWDDLRAQADLSVFVDTPDEVCQQRRLERDVRQYGRSPEESLTRYRNHVRPNQMRYVLPTRNYSDVVVSGTQDIRISLSQVQERLGVPQLA